MRKAIVLAVMFALAVCGNVRSSQRESRNRVTAREVLKSSTDREALERAAITLARSGDAGDLALLGQLLRDREFLARLDDLNNVATLHLSRVIAALGEHPTQQVVDLCLTLAEDPVFLENDRKSFVLELLASVKPMAERTAAVFQRSNDEGYFAFNALLLAGNGSPRALRLFESMMGDRAVAAEIRIECLHRSVLPRRTDPAILATADRILSRPSEGVIANAVVESAFDFRQQWFSIESGISAPPKWEDASTNALQRAAALANKALGRGDLNPILRGTVGKARENILRTLNGRKN
jgi:hypothetical protein